MTDLFEDSPNDQKKADELINAGHLDIVNRSPLSLVFNEDCVAGMKRFSDGHFDLAIVDPPYGIDVANMNMGAGKGKRCSKIENRKWKPKDWDCGIPEENSKHQSECLFNGTDATTFGKRSAA